MSAGHGVSEWFATGWGPEGSNRVRQGMAGPGNQLGLCQRLVKWDELGREQNLRRHRGVLLKTTEPRSLPNAADTAPRRHGACRSRALSQVAACWN